MNQRANLRVAGRVASESNQIDLDMAWESLNNDEDPAPLQIGKLKLRNNDYDVDSGDASGSILFSAEIGMISYAVRVHYKKSRAYKVACYVFVEGGNLRSEDEQEAELKVNSKLDVKVAIATFNDLRKKLAAHFERHSIFTPSRQFKLGKFTMFSRKHGQYQSLEKDSIADEPLVYLIFSRTGVVTQFDLDGVSQDESGKESDAYDCLKQNQKFFADNKFKSPADFINKLKTTKIWARLATLEPPKYWPGRALMLDVQFDSTSKEPKTIQDLDNLRSNDGNRSGYLVFPSQEAYKTAIDALIEAVMQSGGKVLLSSKGALK